MEFIGKFVRLGESKGGQGANGAWQKQDIIIETTGDRPHYVSISCWGGLADTARTFTAGQLVSIIASVESREFNGRWYTDVKAVRFNSQQAMPQAQQPSAQQHVQQWQPQSQQAMPRQATPPLPPVTEEYLKQGGNGDDLPF